MKKIYESGAYISDMEISDEIGMKIHVQHLKDRAKSGLFISRYLHFNVNE